MASTVNENNEDETFQIETTTGDPTWETVQQILKPIASLKLTVALFLASIFIVLAGTFAQVDHDIWKVVHDYFRVDVSNLFGSSLPWFNFAELFVWIDADIFLPESFFPANPPLPEGLQWMATFWPDGSKDLPERAGIYFPKGWTIGILMAMNLLAAHTVRFKVQAKGQRLLIGNIILAFGSLFTLLVIMTGSSTDGVQAEPLVTYKALRMVMLTTMFGLCGATIYGTIALEEKEKRWLCGIGSLLLAMTAIFTAQWQANDEASMRILYQLVKATFAAVILLIGCIAVFKRRAGIVLLHAGIALMMFYDVLVGVGHIESQMTIIEGESANFSRDVRSVEFAVIDRSGQDEDVVTVVNGALLDEEGEKVTDSKLPFEIEVVMYYQNSDIRHKDRFGPMETVPENPATAGMGETYVAVPIENVKGTDTGGRIDAPAAYVKLTSTDGEDLGTWLASSVFDLTDLRTGGTQTVSVGEKSYDIALRFVRHYNPYTIALEDVQKNDYKGTSKVKDYSSFITVTNPEEDLNFDQRIWMNNPMRFAGKTFYQSSYGKMEGGTEYTTLQVVDNAGWMTPYVSCMIVWIGMMYHFGQTLLRYLGRRARNNQKVVVDIPVDEQARVDNLDRIGWAVTGAICLMLVAYVGMKGRPPKEKSGEFHIGTFGELPMWFKGRSMPIDSFARNTLLKLSDYETYRDDEDEKRSAVEWALRVMADDEAARDIHVFKIENKELIEALGLEDRKRFTYSFNELLHSDKVDSIKEMGMLTILRDLEGLTDAESRPQEFEDAASDTPANERSLFQRKLIELSRKVDEYVLFEFTIGGGRIIDQMAAKEAATSQAPSELAKYATKLSEFDRLHKTAFNNQPIALIVPTHIDAENRPDIEAFQTEWQSITAAKTFSSIYAELRKTDDASEYETPPAISLFSEMLAAFKADDPEAFNSKLKAYQNLLSTAKLEGEDENLLSKTSFEALYNRFDAFYLAGVLYVFAGVLAALGWLFLPQIFQRAAFWTIATVFAVHTLALIGRIYISGRPPVTNLYSSAIFIGWAVVLGSLILEMISRLGVANIVGAASGFLTLRIADGLASDGDTFVVLEAVLDTQFWLATHVVCITLGYATTYLAGLFGILYVMIGIFTRSLHSNSVRDESDITFGSNFFRLFGALTIGSVFDSLHKHTKNGVGSENATTVGKEISRMLYGVLCFATFFSFVGTVLGGLWADDSWGRFWGWDPKENGALIIVLWNALVLHARWGNIVKDRGMAVLAVLGNAVVSWSWFGVNELGVGLHSYGFTEGRLAWLAIFVMSQLIIAGIGCLPKNLWMSSSTPPEPVSE